MTVVELGSFQIHETILQNVNYHLSFGLYINHNETPLRSCGIWHNVFYVKCPVYVETFDDVHVCTVRVRYTCQTNVSSDEWNLAH